MFRKVIGQKPVEDSIEPVSAPAPAPESPRPAPEPARTPAPASQPAPRPASSGTSPAATRNVLSSDVEIKGIVKFTNDLVVDGKIEGEIASDGNLTVGENARLRAEIKTATVVVYGKVHGNIIASERVDLKASAEVVGDIKAKTLSIESGAIFVGKSTVGTPSTPANKPVTGDRQDPKPQQPQQQQPQKGQAPQGGGKPQSQPQNRDGQKPQQGNLAGIKS